MADHIYHQEILKNLEGRFAKAFIDDVSATLATFDAPGLRPAFNNNQVTGKLWLIDALHRVAGRQLGTIYVLGGWYGVLAAMLLSDDRLSIELVVSVDRDATCKPVAEYLNRRHLVERAFQAITADMYELDYQALISSSEPRPGLCINTSCEHLDHFGAWYARVPVGTLQVLQSNDYYACEEHVNCVSDLEAFKRQAPMRSTLFAGALRLKKYTRFMLIGYR